MPTLEISKTWKPDPATVKMFEAKKSAILESVFAHFPRERFNQWTVLWCLAKLGAKQTGWFMVRKNKEQK